MTTPSADPDIMRQMIGKSPSTQPPCRWRPRTHNRWGLGCMILIPLIGWVGAGAARATEIAAADEFRKEVQPLLAKYCYDCHGDGVDKGKVSLDEFESYEAMLGNRELWWKVMKNTRAGVMPPQKKPQPAPAEKQR